MKSIFVDSSLLKTCSSFLVVMPTRHCGIYHKINEAEKYWTKLAQRDTTNDETFMHVSTRYWDYSDRQIRITPVWRANNWRTYMQCFYQTSIKEVENAHTRTLHGGVRQKWRTFERIVWWRI